MAVTTAARPEFVDMPALFAMAESVVGAVADPSNVASVHAVLGEAFAMLVDLVEDKRREAVEQQTRERAYVAACEAVGVALLAYFRAVPNATESELESSTAAILHAGRTFAFQGDERLYG
jgi:hypothetical protein